MIVDLSESAIITTITATIGAVLMSVYKWAKNESIITSVLNLIFGNREKKIDEKSLVMQCSECPNIKNSINDIKIEILSETNKLSTDIVKAVMETEIVKESLSSVKEDIKEIKQSLHDMFGILHGRRKSDLEY